MYYFIFVTEAVVTPMLTWQRSLLGKSLSSSVIHLKQIQKSQGVNEDWVKDIDAMVLFYQIAISAFFV